MNRWGGTAITGERVQVADCWPDTARRLRRWLSALRVSELSIDDVIQETALRALTTPTDFDDPEGLFRWSTVVARNVIADEHRRQRRLTYAELPDAPDEVDVEAVVQQRLRLAAVRTVLPSLSAEDQAVLRDTYPSGETRRERVRNAVRLHRARRRLLAMVETIAAWLAWLWRSRPRVRTRTLAATGSGIALVLTAVLSMQAIPSTRQLPPALGLTETIETAPRGGLVEWARSTATTTRTMEQGRTIELRRPKPYLEIGVPRQDGGPDIGGGVRPKQEEDHLACLDTIVFGMQCVDLSAGR